MLLLASVRSSDSFSLKGGAGILKYLKQDSDSLRFETEKDPAYSWGREGEYIRA